MLALILASTYAYDRLWAKGDSLLQEIQSGRDDLFVVVFYNSTNVDETYARVRENNKGMSDTMKYLKKVTAADGPYKDKQVYYATADVTDEMNANLAYKCGIKESMLKNYPVIFAMKSGKGATHYGPVAVSRLEETVKGLMTPPASDDAAKKK